MSEMEKLYKAYGYDDLAKERDLYRGSLLDIAKENNEKVS